MSIYKKNINGSDFLDDKEARALINKTKTSRVTVGHVRAATVGVSTTPNAHPFKVVRGDGSTLVGVHNGTLDEWWRHDDSHHFDVDSEWAISMIAKHGVDAFKYIDGAYAFVWYDSRDPDHLYMCRNDKRPLHYIVTENGKCVLGASEAGMLGWLAERRKFALHKEKHKDKLYSLRPGVMYRFSLDKAGEFEQEDLPKFEDALLGPRMAKTTMSTVMHPYSHMGYDEREWEDDWKYSYTTTQDSVLTAIKQTLSKVRNKPSASSNDKSDVVSGDVLDSQFEKTMEQELLEWENRTYKGKSPYKLEWTEQFLYSPDPSAATKSEQDRASSLQLFGRVVTFHGVYYDPETSNTMGYFEIAKNGKLISKDGIIRMLSKKAADVVLGSTTSRPVKVVIIGHTEDNEYVVRMLTKEEVVMVDGVLGEEQKVN